MDEKELREKIAEKVFEEYGRKVRNVWEIENSKVFVIEGNNHKVICHAMISKTGSILLVE